MKQTVINMEGKEFNNIKVIRRNGSDSKGKALWDVKCHCGNIFTTSGASIRSGGTKSCGCSRLKSAKKMGKGNKTHGETGSKLYSIWHGMKARCYNSNHKSYDYYGGRGIKVCDSWKNSFENFRDWSLNNGYQKELSIERKDVNGNYEPENCKWATMEEQSINRRNNVYLWYEGKAMTQSEICKLTGLSKYKVRKNFKIVKSEDLK